MKKKAIVSKCLLGYNCRYDAKPLPPLDLKKLKDYQIIPVCPEVDLLNLPVPRPRLKLVPQKDKLKLLKEDDGKDLTEELRKRSREFLKKIGRVELAVLKSKSPSCAKCDAKVYPSEKSEEELARATGIFTEQVLALNPNVKILTEEEL
ncbi:MAG: DUF523 domain-containing protein [Aquificae bacterium]|nr:DUF523 domain-containing protein [Aquificota bacterium]